MKLYLNSRTARRKKLRTQRPRPSVFVLYKTRKPITLVHVFRLAEGLGARIVLVGKKITAEDETVLNEFFPRWHNVNWVACSTSLTLTRLLIREDLRPIVIEVSRVAVPYYKCKIETNETPAFILGSEDKGIPDRLLARIRPHVYIPMSGDGTCFSVGMTLAIVASHFAYVASRQSSPA